MGEEMRKCTHPPSKLTWRFAGKSPFLIIGTTSSTDWFSFSIVMLVFGLQLSPKVGIIEIHTGVRLKLQDFIGWIVLWGASLILIPHLLFE